MSPSYIVRGIIAHFVAFIYNNKVPILHQHNTQTTAGIYHQQCLQYKPCHDFNNPGVLLLLHHVHILGCKQKNVKFVNDTGGGVRTHTQFTNYVRMFSRQWSPKTTFNICYFIQKSHGFDILVWFGVGGKM